MLGLFNRITIRYGFVAAVLALAACASPESAAAEPSRPNIVIFLMPEVSVPPFLEGLDEANRTPPKEWKLPDD